MSDAQLFVTVFAVGCAIVWWGMSTNERYSKWQRTRRGRVRMTQPGKAFGSLALQLLILAALGLLVISR